MRKLIILSATSSLALVGGTALALDTDKTILCATTQVQECVDGVGCKSVLPEDVNAPDFLRVNVKKKEIVVRPSQPPVAIEHFEEVEDRLIMQGAEDGNKDQPDGVGWTLSINHTDARFVAAIAADQAALVLFGACTEI